MSKKPAAKCVLCAGGLAQGTPYFAGGAVIDQLLLRKWKLDDSIMEGFCHIGFHGAKSDMSDSADYVIVDHVDGGQFEIQFCSIACLRKWFNNICDDLEVKLRGQAQKTMRRRTHSIERIRQTADNVQKAKTPRTAGNRKTRD